MSVIKENLAGSPNIGLFGIVRGDKLLFGERLRSDQKARLEKALGAEYLRVHIAGTSLPGIMLAGNKHALLAPHIIFDAEKEVLEKAGIDVTVLETTLTCFGNTIACNDHGAILSTEFTQEEASRIEEALKVPCVQADIAGLTTPGAVIMTRGEHAVIHKDASDEEARLIEKTLKVTVAPATVNLGSPHLKAGIILSEHGLVVGDHSGGPEIVNLDEALGYHEVSV